jgi:uncharacterized membrane protein
MGASVSTNVQNTQNSLITSAVQKCPPVTAANLVNFTGTNFTAPPDCPGGGNFDITQAAVVDSTCVLSSLQQAAAETAQTLNADAKAGLGIAVSTNVGETQNNIKNYTNQSCAKASSSNTVNLKDVNIKACNLTVTQNASDNTNCQINATQDLISKIAVSSGASSTGLFGDLFSGSWGKYILIVVAVIVIIGIIIALYKVLGKKSNKKIQKTSSTKIEETTGGGYFDELNKPYIILIIVALLIVIVFMINHSSSKEKQITENDVDSLNQKISEANKIAGFSPKQNIIEQSTMLPYQQPVMSGHWPEPMSDGHYYSDQSDFSNGPYSESEPVYYKIGYNYGSEKNTLDDFYKPLLY